MIQINENVIVVNFTKKLTTHIPDIVDSLWYKQTNKSVTVVNYTKDP